MNKWTTSWGPVAVGMLLVGVWACNRPGSQTDGAGSKPSSVMPAPPPVQPAAPPSKKSCGELLNCMMACARGTTTAGATSNNPCFDRCVQGASEDDIVLVAMAIKCPDEMCRGRSGSAYQSCIKTHCAGWVEDCVKK